MPRKKVKRRQSLRTMLAHSPELHEVSRQLATLAVTRLDGPLGVRQREQLRRALAIAGDALCWTEAATNGGDAVAEVSNDITTMAKGGAKFITSDLAEGLVKKRTEISQRHDVAAAALKLSENSKATYPAEITYLYTARDASQGLITKTETLTVNDAREALRASESIERSTTSRGKLTELMILDLEHQQKRLDVMTKDLAAFLQSSHELLPEVIANL